MTSVDGATAAFQMNPARRIRFKTDGSTLLEPSSTLFCIGRSADCRIHLPALDVSRRHAMVAHTHGDWWITDVGSKAGTWVNGIRIKKSCRLEDGDRIELGSVRLKCLVDQPTGPRHAPQGDPSTWLAENEWLVTVDRAAIWLEPDGTTGGASEGAYAWLAPFADAPGDPLPTSLRRWLADSQRFDHPYEARDGESRLRIHCCPEAAGREFLVIDRLRDALSPASLRQLGFTKTESLAAGWLIKGKRNNEIAGILGISPKTAEKHVTSIIAKLEVENRASAAWALLEKLGAHR